MKKEDITLQREQMQEDVRRILDGIDNDQIVDNVCQVIVDRCNILADKISGPYIYDLSQGNPEGTDYSLQFYHEESFTREQFQDICEAALVETCKLQKEREPQRYFSLVCLDTCILTEVMGKKGFVPILNHASYYLEPYWGKDSVKNEELLKIIKKE